MNILILSIITKQFSQRDSSKSRVEEKKNFNQNKASSTKFSFFSNTQQWMFDKEKYK